MGLGDHFDRDALDAAPRSVPEPEPAVRLLIVEDEPEISAFIVQAVQEAGFAADAAGDGQSALALAEEGVYDAFVVDLGLPDMDGLSVIDGLRARGVRAPVLILSARRTVADRVRGLEQGGDDYLPKPFAVAELIARLRALLRRSGDPSGEATTIRVADLEIDLVRHEARRGGKPLALSHRELQLLAYLAANAGRVLTRSMILDHVWQMRFDPQTNVVDVHVHRLRGKVDRGFDPPLIHTVRAVGYVLEPPSAP
jgi:two-component system copper resistance phosphate regulon response regulator CusR